VNLKTKILGPSFREGARQIMASILGCLCLARKIVVLHTVSALELRRVPWKIPWPDLFPF